MNRPPGPPCAGLIFWAVPGERGMGSGSGPAPGRGEGVARIDGATGQVLTCPPRMGYYKHMAAMEPPAAPRDAGQESKMSIKRQVWVVVVNAGTVDQYQDDDFISFEKARDRADKIEQEENCKADVMKRLPDGTLTTEY